MDGMVFDRPAALRFGWETAKSRFIFFLGLIAVSIVGFVLLDLLHDNLPGSMLKFVLSLCTNVWGMLISIGTTCIVLKICDGGEPALGDLFVGPGVLWAYIVASVLSGAFIVFGMLLLVIPGIIFYVKLMFYAYSIADRSGGIMNSLQESWALTAGKKWDLFMFTIYLGLINLLGLLCVGVGLLWTLPMWWMATAHVYRQLAPKAQGVAAAQ